MTSATYLYCVAGGRAAPRLARAPRGLPEMGRPRAVRVGAGLWLVVADAPLSRYAAGAVETGLRDLDWVSRCALAHEAVVAHVSRSGATVVPTKMFTLFGDDTRALAHVARLRKRLDALLRRIAGREEWGLRLMLDERRAMKRATEDRDDGPASGTEFLLRKKAVKDAGQRMAARARVEADRLFDDLARHADDARRRRPAPGTPARLLLEAAFLVSRSRARTFRAEITRRARALAPEGYDLSLSGPWPPYSFVSDAS